jgi:hypothetical protein
MEAETRSQEPETVDDNVTTMVAASCDQTDDGRVAADGLTADPNPDRESRVPVDGEVVTTASGSVHAAERIEGPGEPAMHAGGSSWLAADTTALELHHLDRPEARSSDARPHETVVVEPESVEDTPESDPPAGPGRWLPLRDALREVGSLEHLYRLAHDGLLRSREDEHGQAEIWIADSERYAEPAPASEPDGDVAPTTTIEETATADADSAVAALIARLVEAHEREVRLARENGALGERAASFQRELAELRTRYGASPAPLAEATDRQLQLARENGVLSERLAVLERKLDALPDSQAHSSDARMSQDQPPLENGDLTARLAALEHALEEARRDANAQERMTRVAGPGGWHSGRVGQALVLLHIVAAVIVALSVGWLLAHAW